MKTIIASIVAVLVLAATPAFAQMYPGYPSYGATACTTISRNLAYGSQGSDVSALQAFLVAQNYPGSGSWMETGYFGRATEAAVRNFQSSRGLPATGVVDAATRAAIAACNTYTGNTGFPYTYSYNYNSNQYGNPYGSYPYSYSYPYQQYPSYQYPYNYNYNYNYGYGFPYYGAPSLSSLAPNSGYPGTTVTVYGTGFDYANNTIYVGGSTISNVASPNGTMLSFTLPSNAAGLTSVSVGTSRGISNALTFTVLGANPNPNPCSYYYCPPTTVLSITALSPQSGSVGSSVTVYGYGFSSTGNTVRFGNGVITGLLSTDGRSVSFTVPASISGYGYQPIGLGTYNVSVTNASGATSNALPFTVTSTGTTQAPSITNVSGPTALSVNQSGVWSITVNTDNAPYASLSVRWGDENLYGYTAAAQNVTVAGTQTYTLSHSYGEAGTYTPSFTVTNSSGQSTTASATVTIGGQSSNLSISSISPASGRIGTQVAIVGSGFSPTDNTVHFGGGGLMHVPSYNGTTIYYTVPSYLSPCDVTPQGNVCAQYIQQVTPGSYPVYVTNGSAQSNTVNFTVTQ